MVCGTRDCGDADCAANPPPPADFSCPFDDGFFEDPDNCIRYFRCSGGVANEVTCHAATDGSTEVYDTLLHSCRPEEEVDCGERPVCDEFDENCQGETTGGTTVAQVLE